MTAARCLTRRGRAGYLGADVMVALAVVAVLTLVLTISTTRQRRSTDRLAETRELVRFAEHALTAAQTGAPPPAPPAGTTVTLRRAEGTADAPPACAWAVVTVTRNGRSQELIGLVRADALAGGAP